eukprot:scaffold14005_cov177-Isochrysis_galbana.AAC.3
MGAQRFGGATLFLAGVHAPASLALRPPPPLSRSPSRGRPQARGRLLTGGAEACGGVLFSFQRPSTWGLTGGKGWEGLWRGRGAAGVRVDVLGSPAFIRFVLFLDWKPMAGSLLRYVEVMCAEGSSGERRAGVGLCYCGGGVRLRLVRTYPTCPTRQRCARRPRRPITGTNRRNSDETHRRRVRAWRPCARPRPSV